jgi:hypothetical protein
LEVGLSNDLMPALPFTKRTVITASPVAQRDDLLLGHAIFMAPL